MGQLARFAGAVALVVALFLPVFRNGFVYDDDAVIERGDLIHDPTRMLELFSHPTMHASPQQREKTRSVDTYRPVTMLTFFWDAQLSGKTPWSYHLTNLLAHLLVLVVLFRIALRLLGAERWAWLAVAWFTLTPLPQAAHIWINGRSDVFCAIFGGASILTTLRARDHASSEARKWGLRFASGALFLSALLCKEIWLGTLPSLLFLPARTDETPSAQYARARWRDRLTQIAPALAATATYFVLRFNALSGMRVHETRGGVYLALARLPLLWLDAAVETLVPARVYLRCMYYDYRGLSPVLLGACWVVVIALGILLFRARERFPVQWWGALWFAGTLAPVAMISTMVWPGFGRYLYVPAIGLVLAMTNLVARIWEARPVARRALVILSAIYGLLLAVRLEIWIADYRDGESLFKAVIAADPGSPHGYGWLGFTRHNRGQYAQAIGPLELAFQRDPRPLYLEPLANSYMQTKRFEEAFGAAVTGLKISPQPRFYMIVVDAMQQRQPEMAAKSIADCLLYNPNHPPCLRVYKDLISAHPRASEYRTIFRRLLALKTYAQVRAAVGTP